MLQLRSDGTYPSSMPKPDLTLPYKPDRWNMQLDSHQQQNKSAPQGISVTKDSVLFLDQNVFGPTGVSRVQTTDGPAVSDRGDTVPMETAWTGLLIDRPDSLNADRVDDSVRQISGAGHWFLEGWIGGHLVEFLVDSGSSVTAMSDSLYQTLVNAGAPVGALGRTSRMLRGASGSKIDIQGYSRCVVSFMGLKT